MNYTLGTMFTRFHASIREIWLNEKRMNREQVHIIHQKNKLMLVVFTTLLFLDILTNIFIFPEIIPTIIITAGLGCMVVGYFVLHPKLAKVGMYVTVCASFVPFWVVAYLDKDVINFYFLSMPLIMSSLYNRILPIIISSFITCITLSFFYIDYSNIVFSNHLKVDVIYFILFSIFVTIFLLFSSRLTGSLLLRAEEKEKRTSLELLSTKEYLEAYFNNTTDAIGVYDLQGTILKANGSFEKMFEVEAKDIVGNKTSFLSFTSGNSLRVFLTKLTNQKQLSFELLTSTKSGAPIDVSITVTPVKNSDGTILALVFLMKDITDKKRTEEALMQSEKLSVIGELAAGVAHEIRNPVTVLKGFVHILSQETREKEFYTIMDKELERINQITNEFMALAKPQAVHFKKQDLKELIQEVCLFLESEAFIHQVVIEVVHPDEYIWLNCEPNQLKQVLINTIKNGMEAMPNGGKITIQTKVMEGFVHLSIMDEGTGIPEEVIHKVGQPFFTTKDQGTGLGLMVSMKIIENHGGQLSIHSQVDKGSTVEILLPHSN
ncbi:ATP-binding protein [Sutcliffiella horikoshii]|uniref:ATP-binding protein n=1 Tax=Sutcliffiella horikoshii TaxID=79883 RepID=UPI001F1FCBF5|nr:ATP-binding protein [Sutcliffiella horikoshii]MCG1022432.1 PAS domain S-box protein [Sutcliffiella horikoshii]